MRRRRARADHDDMTTVLTPRHVAPARLEWLRTEIDAWQNEGLLHDGQADTILSSYQASRRFGLTKFLLTLGATFVGFGVIWLVAANLDQLSPALRFVLVTTLWLALLVGGEVLAARTATPSLAAGAVRILAALSFGAVIAQAAQSLQVPAWDQTIALLWGLGAMVHAYTVRATGPLVVGLGALTGWYLWEVPWDSGSLLSPILALAVGSVVAVSAGAAQERWFPRFAAPWREAGALMALAAMFVAAVPDDLGTFTWTPWLTGGVLVAAACALVATTLAGGIGRFEVAGVVAAAGVACLLMHWTPDDLLDEGLSPGTWAHAVASVTAYVVLAVAVAALGAVRDSWRLTALATGAVVVFTTFQSFAIFARVIQGSVLFLVLGLVFLATGLLFDRARRGVARTLEEA
jgi:uncharacterized membrane protein